MINTSQMYGKVLLEDFKSELSGNFRKLVRALMLPPALFDAHELRNAMKGLGEFALHNKDKYKLLLHSNLCFK